MDEPRPDDAPSEQPDQSAQQPDQPAQEPVDISADVDALLAQAASLAGEIAEDTGAQVDADAAPSLAEADALAADPKDAVDDVEKKLAELEKLVGVTTEDGADDDSGFITETSSLIDEDEAEDAGPSITPGDAKAKPAAAADAIPGDDFDTTLCGDIDVSLDDDIVDEPEDFGLDAGAKPAVAALRKPLETILGAPKAIGGAFKRFFAKGFIRRLGDTLICRAILAGLELIDGPFAGLSPAAKRNIGIIAIITVLTGVASHFLPSMFNSNPYLDMAMNP